MRNDVTADAFKRGSGALHMHSLGKKKKPHTKCNLLCKPRGKSDLNIMKLQRKYQCLCYRHFLPGVSVNAKRMMRLNFLVSLWICYLKVGHCSAQRFINSWQVSDVSLWPYQGCGNKVQGLNFLLIRGDLLSICVPTSSVSISAPSVESQKVCLVPCFADHWVAFREFSGSEAFWRDLFLTRWNQESWE